MGEFKAVIFDWDGTLFDSIKYELGVYRRLFKILGIDNLHWKNFREEFHADYHKYYAEKGIPPGAFEEVDRLWIQLYEEEAKELKLMPGARRLLAALKRKKIRMGIVSNGSGKRIRRELREHGIAGYFQVVVTGDEIPEFKPSPKGVVYACGALKVKPGETLYVGDMADDMLAGRGAGAKAAAVASGIHTVKRLLKEEPDYLMKDVRGVLRII